MNEKILPPSPRAELLAGGLAGSAPIGPARLPGWVFEGFPGPTLPLSPCSASAIVYTM